MKTAIIVAVDVVLAAAVALLIRMVTRLITFLPP
jgi:hypothetical protein